MERKQFNRFFRAAFDRIESRDRDTLEYSLAAVIVSGGRILSIGINKQKKHGLVEAFKINEWSNLHAECDAVIKARKKIDLTGAKVYVARLTLDGRVGMAMPCEMCCEVLRTYGIRKVYFTVDNETYDSIRL